MIKFNNIQMKPKLIGLFLLIGLFPLALIGWFAENQASSALLEKSFAQLEAVREIRRLQIKQYFDERYRDILALSTNGLIVDALQSADKSYHEFSKNNKPIGGDEWQSSLNQELVLWLTTYKKDHAYHDLFLIDLEGNVIFTVERESDLGQNLTQSPLDNTGLGKLFKTAQQDIAIEDFHPFAPSNNAFAAFIGAPIKDRGELGRPNPALGADRFLA